MRYINPHFTYLLTITHQNHHITMVLQCISILCHDTSAKNVPYLNNIFYGITILYIYLCPASPVQYAGKDLSVEWSIMCQVKQLYSWLLYVSCFTCLFCVTNTFDFIWSEHVYSSRHSQSHTKIYNNSWIWSAHQLITFTVCLSCMHLMLHITNLINMMNNSLSWNASYTLTSRYDVASLATSLHSCIITLRTAGQTQLVARSNGTDVNVQHMTKPSMVNLLFAIRDCWSLITVHCRWNNSQVFALRCRRRHLYQSACMNTDYRLTQFSQLTVCARLSHPMTTDYDVFQ